MLGLALLLTLVPAASTPLTADEGLVIADGVLIDYKGAATTVTTPAKCMPLTWPRFRTGQAAGIQAAWGIRFFADRMVCVQQGYAHTGQVSSGRGDAYTVPDHVTAIGREAFYGCTGMTAINTGSNVTVIGYSAFSSCHSLTTLVIAARYVKSVMGIRQLPRPEDIAYRNGAADHRQQSLCRLRGIAAGFAG